MLRKTTLLSLVLALAGCGGGGGGETHDHAHEHAGGEAHAHPHDHADGEQHDHEHGDAHHAEGHHEGGEDHEHHFPPTVNAFHDVLAPAWHSEPGETRRAAGCDAVGEMQARVGAIGGETPEGVDAAAWSASAESLSSAVDALGEACEGEPDAAEERLREVHDAFHALVEHVGHEG